MFQGSKEKQGGGKFFSIRVPLLRIIIVALAAYLVFSQVLIPLKIRGSSMEPTYMDGDFTFSFRFRYLWSQPQRGDIVTVRFAGRKIMLLKRVVALEGEAVSFVDGLLYIDGNPVDEPYLHFPFHWNLPSRTVKKGHVYVIGDNRGTPMQEHDFGQTPLTRVTGAPIW